MGLFRNNYNTPGPGVRKDEKPKKGLPRFFEIVFRDMGDLFKLNMIMLLICTPLLISAFLLYDTKALIFILPVILFGALAGAGICAGLYVITKMVRNNPGFLWHDFKKHFKADFKQGAIAGSVVFGGLSLLIMSAWLYKSNMSKGGIDIIFYIYVFAIALAIFSSFFVFFQIANVSLDLKNTFKNSIFLAFACANRLIPCVIICAIHFAILILFYPLSSFLVVIYGLSFPMLMMSMWLWPALTSVFDAKNNLDNKE